MYSFFLFVVHLFESTLQLPNSVLGFIRLQRDFLNASWISLLFLRLLSECCASAFLVKNDLDRKSANSFDVLVRGNLKELK